MWIIEFGSCRGSVDPNADWPAEEYEKSADPIVNRPAEKMMQTLSCSSWMTDDLLNDYVELCVSYMRVQNRSALEKEESAISRTIETEATSIVSYGKKLSELREKEKYLIQMGEDRILGLSAEADRFVEMCKGLVSVEINLDPPTIVGLIEGISITSLYMEEHEVGSFGIVLKLDGRGGVVHMRNMEYDGKRGQKPHHPHVNEFQQPTRSGFIEAILVLLSAGRYVDAFQNCLDYLRIYDENFAIAPISEWPVKKKEKGWFFQPKKKSLAETLGITPPDLSILQKQYLQLCGCGKIADEVLAVQKKIAELIARIPENRRALAKNRERREELKRMLSDENLLDQEIVKRVAREFLSLGNIPEIKGLAINLKEGKITVRTNVIVMGSKKLGEYDCELWQNGTSRFWNRTRTCNGYQHPHVKGNGVPCLGNAGGSMKNLLEKRQFPEAITLALNFLQSTGGDKGYGDASLDEW